MGKRFECNFAVGENGGAYSAVWLVVAKKSDLYIPIKAVSGEIKATVHRPNPPKYPEYGRFFGFVDNATGPVADAVMADRGERHLLQSWPGYPLGPTCTLEIRIRVRGISLADTATQVPSKVKLLPVPREHECVDVGVLLGEVGSLYPKELEEGTNLLDEGHLSDGGRVWIIYKVHPLREAGGPLPPSSLITPKKSYLDHNAELRSNARAITYEVSSNGNLDLMDCRAEAEGEAALILS